MTTTGIILDARASGHRTHDRAGARSLGARASAFSDEGSLARDIGLLAYATAAVLAAVMLWYSQV